MRSLHDALIKAGFKIGIPLLLFSLITGIIIIFHEFWIGLITIFSSALLLSFGIASYMCYRRDRKSYLKAHIHAIAWRDFAILLFFSLFFLFPSFTSFYGGDEETAKFFFALFITFIILAIIIGYQNRRLRI